MYIASIAPTSSVGKGNPGIRELPVKCVLSAAYAATMQCVRMFVRKELFFLTSR